MENLHSGRERQAINKKANSMSADKDSGADTGEETGSVSACASCFGDYCEGEDTVIIWEKESRQSK